MIHVFQIQFTAFLVFFCYQLNDNRHKIMSRNKLLTNKIQIYSNFKIYLYVVGFMIGYIIIIWYFINIFKAFLKRFNTWNLRWNDTIQNQCIWILKILIKTKSINYTSKLQRVKSMYFFGLLLKILSFCESIFHQNICLVFKTFSSILNPCSIRWFNKKTTI